MKVRYLLLLAVLLGAGCSPSQSLRIPGETAPQAQKEARGESGEWLRYTNREIGVSLRYPGIREVNLDQMPAELPDAVGQKARTLKIDSMPTWKVERDADGCIKWTTAPVRKEKITKNNQDFCLSILDDGAAGSTIRTYHYTTLFGKNTVVDVMMSVKFPTSVRVYAECENEADREKPRCKELTFDEARDTKLFGEILDTVRQVPGVMPGSDRDEHGCIGSAGYSWCEVKQKCLRIWEEPCQ